MLRIFGVGGLVDNSKTDRILAICGMVAVSAIGLSACGDPPTSTREIADAANANGRQALDEIDTLKSRVSRLETELADQKAQQEEALAIAQAEAQQVERIRLALNHNAVAANRRAAITQ